MRFRYLIVLLSLAGCGREATPEPATPDAEAAAESPAGADYGEQRVLVVGKTFQAQMPDSWMPVYQLGSVFDGHDIFIRKDDVKIEVFVETYGRSYAGLIRDIQSHLGSPNTPLQVLALNEPNFGFAVTFGDGEYGGVAVLRQMNNGSEDALVIGMWPTKDASVNALGATLDFARSIESRAHPAAPAKDEAVPAEPAEEKK
jgi:hypothetical protein